MGLRETFVGSKAGIPMVKSVKRTQTRMLTGKNWGWSAIELTKLDGKESAQHRMSLYTA